MKLRAIAHSRTGDKGNILNISVIAFDEADYPRLMRQVTAESVKAQLAGVIGGDVVRYELPMLGALNFVLTRASGESVTRTLGLDAHLKSLSSALLDMDLPE